MSMFPAAEISFTKIKVKAVIVCEYELKNMDDYETVREDIEEALTTLQKQGSANVSFETTKTEMKPAGKRRGGK